MESGLLASFEEASNVAASRQPPFRTDMLRWELAKGACPSATDDVLVHLPSRARPNQW